MRVCTNENYCTIWLCCRRRSNGKNVTLFSVYICSWTRMKMISLPRLRFSLYEEKRRKKNFFSFSFFSSVQFLYTLCGVMWFYFVCFYILNGVLFRKRTLLPKKKSLKKNIKYLHDGMNCLKAFKARASAATSVAAWWCFIFFFPYPQIYYANGVVIVSLSLTHYLFLSIWWMLFLSKKKTLFFLLFHRGDVRMYIFISTGFFECLFDDNKFPFLLNSSLHSLSITLFALLLVSMTFCCFYCFFYIHVINIDTDVTETKQNDTQYIIIIAADADADDDQKME